MRLLWQKIGVAGISWILSTMPVLAATQLKIDMLTHYVSRPNVPVQKMPANTQESLTVVMAKDYLSVTTWQGSHIYDFKSRQHYILNPISKEYVQYSLYDVVGFRYVEFGNRERLRGVLQAAQIKSPVSAFDDAHILSMILHEPAVLQDQSTESWYQFGMDDHEIARWTKAGTMVNAEQAAAFVRFLRYQLGGYPTLFAHLVEQQSIPNKLIFSFNQLLQSTTTVNVLSVHSIAAEHYQLTGYTRRQSMTTPDPVEAILDKAAALSLEALPLALTENTRAVNELFAQGHILEGALGFVEVGLMGGQMTLTDEQKALMKTDPATLRFFKAMTTPTAADVRQAIATLMELRSQAPKKAYVLMVMEANDHLQLHEPAEAKQLFVTALQQNPLLVGGYKDLGDLELTEFHVSNAWRSWDAGRRLAPTFINFESVNRFEAMLLTNYPEFF